MPLITPKSTRPKGFLSTGGFVEALIIVTIVAIIAAIVIPNCFDIPKHRIVEPAPVGVREVYTGTDEVHVKLSNGKTVTCLQGGYGALSCDWSNAK